MVEKVEEYESTIESIKSEFKKERKDLIEKIKRLKNKNRELEIDKNEDQERYESVILSLNEEIFKIEGRKYFFNNKYVKDLRDHERKEKYERSNEMSDRSGGRSGGRSEEVEIHERNKNKNRNCDSEIVMKMEEGGSRLVVNNNENNNNNNFLNSIEYYNKSLNSHLKIPIPKYVDNKQNNKLYNKLNNNTIINTNPLDKKLQNSNKIQMKENSPSNLYHNVNQSYESSSVEKNLSQLFSDRKQKLKLINRNNLNKLDTGNKEFSLYKSNSYNKLRGIKEDIKSKITKESVDGYCSGYGSSSGKIFLYKI